VGGKKRNKLVDGTVEEAMRAGFEAYPALENEDSAQKT